MRASPHQRHLRLTSAQRRQLLKLAAASGILAAIERNVALAQSAPDYKALVCVNLSGGNDGENTLIRSDAAGYQNYAAVRPTASGINIPQSQLLPIHPARGGPPFGFHPACAALQSLFNQKKLAVIANVGMLVQPSTRSGLLTGGAPRPANMFSHADQELAMQSAVYTGAERVGWGGRVADRLEGANPGTLFPPLVSIGGSRTFVSGRTSVPLSVPEYLSFSPASSGDRYPNSFQFDVLRDAAMRQVLAKSRSNIYDTVAQLYAQEGLAASSVVAPILQNPASVVAQAFVNLNTSVAKQLRNVAQLIEGRAKTQMRRQVFYVDQGGYDTHGQQPGIQQQLLGDLSSAVKAFEDAMAALGVTDSVTLFTLSEFGRTFKPAANNGTDHGWGNYAFVVGGAVRGGDFYGTVPTQALNGPDDLGDAGRWIPTTSIEQYAAPLCRWFGIGESDLPYIFPNIGAFPNTNLGFMS
ncbi:MAG TPA: DUF1501 domain-containing protein [Blastocatellia bacterium]|nr:DUF1501 domain-containing protein [Blastocatellia bacterium]